jgi:DNA-binding GntR family transcriptional regulator
VPGWIFITGKLKAMKMPMLPKEAERIYEAMKGKIINGEYAPGFPLSEIPLSIEYGTKRTRIRQILQRLERESLVEIFPHRGAFVKPITSKDLQEIFEMREAIESMAARLCARRRDDQALRQICDLFEKYRKPPTDGYLKEKIEMGDRLHQFIMENSKNGRIVDTMQHLKLQIMRVWEVGIRIPDRINSAFREHLEILSAVMERDEALAERKMKEHISNAFRDYIQMTLLDESGIPENRGRQIKARTNPKKNLVRETSVKID